MFNNILCVIGATDSSVDSAIQLLSDKLNPAVLSFIEYTKNMSFMEKLKFTSDYKQMLNVIDYTSQNTSGLVVVRDYLTYGKIPELLESVLNNNGRVLGVYGHKEFLDSEPGAQKESYKKLNEVITQLEKNHPDRVYTYSSNSDEDYVNEVIESLCSLGYESGKLNEVWNEFADSVEVSTSEIKNSPPGSHEVDANCFDLDNASEESLTIEQTISKALLELGMDVAEQENATKPIDVKKSKKSKKKHNTQPQSVEVVPAQQEIKRIPVVLTSLSDAEDSKLESICVKISGGTMVVFIPSNSTMTQQEVGGILFNTIAVRTPDLTSSRLQVLDVVPEVQLPSTQEDIQAEISQVEAQLLVVQDEHLKTQLKKYRLYLEKSLYEHM